LLKIDIFIKYIEFRKKQMQKKNPVETLGRKEIPVPCVALA